MIELVLVRHGEPDWEPTGRAVDRPDLTPLGRAQAEATATALAERGESFDAVYVSPLPRARQTAEPIARALGADPLVLPWLAEMRLPSLEGKSASAVQDYFAAARLRRLDEWWDGLPGEGERFAHFYERVVAGLESLLCEDHGAAIHDDGAHRIWHPATDARRLLCVAHEGTNAVAMSHLLGIEPVPFAFVRFAMDWCGITRLHTVPVAGAAVWALREWNQCAHLAPLRASESRVIPEA